jgi:Uma2 family endonuclease
MDLIREGRDGDTRPTEVGEAGVTDAPLRSSSVAETHCNKPRGNPDSTMQTTVSVRTAHLQPHRFTISEYLAMGEIGILQPEDRVELIDGQIVAMSPIGVWHSTSVRLLARLFQAQVPKSLVVDIQNPLNVGETTQVVPDLALIRADRNPWKTPVRGQDCVLVVEVAETSLATDRTTKMALYATVGIPEYWIVDLAGRTIEVYGDPDAGVYRSRAIHGRGVVVTPEAVPDVAVPVSEVIPPPDGA